MISFWKVRLILSQHISHYVPTSFPSYSHFLLLAWGCSSAHKWLYSHSCRGYCISQRMKVTTSGRSHCILYVIYDVYIYMIYIYIYPIIFPLFLALNPHLPRCPSRSEPLNWASCRPGWPTGCHGWAEAQGVVIDCWFFQQLIHVYIQQLCMHVFNRLTLFTILWPNCVSMYLFAMLFFSFYQILWSNCLYLSSKAHSPPL